MTTPPLTFTTRPLPSCCNTAPVYQVSDFSPYQYQVYCPSCHRQVTGWHPDAVFQVWASAPLELNK